MNTASNPRPLKIAWICHLSNPEIQKIIHPGITTNELAPWITQLARLVENEENIELHIIAPNRIMKGRNHFTLGNVHYHFFSPNIQYRKWNLLDFFNFNLKSEYFYNKFTIAQLVNKIKPDLVHLHGVENAYYSSSIFQFRKKYPVLITIQGFLSHTTEKENDYLRKHIGIEQRILKTFTHFGYRTRTMGNDIRSFNPGAILHWHHYPLPEIRLFEEEKKFDVVFFARICKDKGIEDLLKAISLAKKKIPGVRCCIIGHPSSPEYLGFLKSEAEKLGIADNIFWAGFLKTQAEVHKMASSARISILPTYSDIISGTIIESMKLKIPVVAYDTGSIHEVNDNGTEYIALVPQGDVAGLAEKITFLLRGPEELKKRSENGFRRANEMFDNSKIVPDLMNAYHSVIHDFEERKKASH